MKWVVEALGYEDYFVSGRVGMVSLHVIIVLTNVLRPGDRILFDPGMGYPTFELTPLDFETETEVYSHLFFYVQVSGLLSPVQTKEWRSSGFTWCDGKSLDIYHTR